MRSIQRNGKKRPFCRVGSTEIFGNLSVVLGYRKIRCCTKHRGQTLGAGAQSSARLCGLGPRNSGNDPRPGVRAPAAGQRSGVRSAHHFANSRLIFDQKNCFATGTGPPLTFPRHDCTKRYRHNPFPASSWLEVASGISRCIVRRRLRRVPALPGNGLTLALIRLLAAGLRAVPANSGSGNLLWHEHRANSDLENARAYRRRANAQVAQPRQG
jgi:hypothetical protein